MSDPLRRTGGKPAPVSGVDLDTEEAVPYIAAAPAEADDTGGEPHKASSKGGSGGGDSGGGRGREPARNDPECVMYVRGLSGTTAEEEAIKQLLKGTFASVGEVVRIQLPSFRDEGRLKGFGFVHFRDAETCAAAIKQGKGGHWKLHGRPLLVRSLNPPKAAAEIGDEGGAKDHALVEGRRAGGVLAQREKELPGMIVQPACLLCRLENRTCAICSEYPSNPEHGLSDGCPAPDASLNPSFSVFAQLPALNTQHLQAPHVSLPTYPTYPVSAPPLLPPYANGVLGATVHQDYVPSGTRVDIAAMLANGAAPPPPALGGSAEAVALREELAAVLATSCEEMERAAAERSSLEALLYEARATESRATEALTRERAHAHELALENEYLHTRLKGQKSEAALRAEIEAEVEAERLREMDELEALLVFEETGKRPPPKVSAAPATESKPKAGKNKSQLKDAKDVELEDLRKEMARLRKQLASMVAAQSSESTAAASVGGPKTNSNPPKVAKKNTGPLALVALVTDSCAQELSKPAMPKLQLVHI